ncbi:hypothetical protein NXV73_03975 [Bacteroides salyersiae]|nr:hypothetical protein [Bacteroides salyersiae]
MKKSRILLLFSLILLCYHTESAAQRSNIKDYVRIEITPDHDDWTYRTNEQASFTIRVIRGNVALKNIPLTYEIGPEKNAARTDRKEPDGKRFSDRKGRNDENTRFHPLSMPHGSRRHCVFQLCKYRF